MSSSVAFNTTDVLTVVAAQLAKGGHSDLVIAGETAGNTGVIQDIVAKQNAAILITFSSPTAFQVYAGGVSAGTGSVGVAFTSSAVDFLATGTFSAGEQYSFQTFAPPAVLRNTATQLVWQATRGGASAWIGLELTTAGSSVPILRIASGISLNSSQTVSNQTGAVAGYMPLASNTSASLNWRWDGGALTLRITDGVACKVIGAGFLASVHNPAAWSHPLFAYGCATISGTTTTYKAGAQTATTQVRDPAGTVTTLTTGLTSATASAIATAAPGTAGMPLVPILGHIATVGCVGSIPGSFVAWPNVGFGQMLQARNRLLMPSWSGTDTSWLQTSLTAIQN